MTALASLGFLRLLDECTRLRRLVADAQGPKLVELEVQHANAQDELRRRLRLTSEVSLNAEESQ